MPDREKQLEEALRNLLTIFDSEEMKGQALVGSIPILPAQKWIDAARELLKEQT